MAMAPKPCTTHMIPHMDPVKAANARTEQVLQLMHQLSWAYALVLEDGDTTRSQDVLDYLVKWASESGLGDKVGTAMTITTKMRNMTRGGIVSQLRRADGDPDGTKWYGGTRDELGRKIEEEDRRMEMETRRLDRVEAEMRKALNKRARSAVDDEDMEHEEDGDADGLSKPAAKRLRKLLGKKKFKQLMTKKKARKSKKVKKENGAHRVKRSGRIGKSVTGVKGAIGGTVGELRVSGS